MALHAEVFKANVLQTGVFNARVLQTRVFNARVLLTGVFNALAAVLHTGVVKAGLLQCDSLRFLNCSLHQLLFKYFIEGNIIYNTLKLIQTIRLHMLHYKSLSNSNFSSFLISSGMEY